MILAFAKLYGIPDAEQEVNIIFDNVDNDNNGYIEYEEFIRASIDKSKLLTDQILNYAFKFFDKDGSKEITIEELKSSLFSKGEKLGPDDERMIKNILKDIDLDNTDTIDLKEFKQLMKKLVS